MKKHLRTRVTMAFLTGILGAMLLMNLFCGLMLKPLFIYNSKVQMQKYGGEMENAFQDAPDTLDELLSSVYDAYLIRTIIVENGQITYSSERWTVSKTIEDKKSTQYLVTLIEEYQAQSCEPYICEHYNDDNQLRSLYYVDEIGENSYLVLAKSIKGIEENSQIVAWFLLFSGILTALLGILIWSFVMRGFTREMDKICRVAKKLEQLNFEERTNHHGSDEVGVLAESIDHLADKLEESIQDMQKELEHRKELLRSLAHEIKTPLTTIKGYTESLQIVTEGNDRAQRYCGIMLEECDSLDILAREMMEVSALDSTERLYQLSSLEMGAAFEQFQERIQRELPGDVVLVEAENCTLTANQYLLERVVFNYLFNAVKYRKPGTVILLKGRVVQGKYYISVTNTGDPITEQEQERIWDAFYKGDKSRRRDNSYGIGLYVVRQIANILHGEAGVVSQKNCNTFYFCIPLTNENRNPAIEA